MKKSIRNSLIISVILILCGAVIVFVSLNMVEFDFTKLATDKQISVSKEISEPFYNINIKISTEDLKIAQSDSDKCSLEYICPENLEYNISVSDGALTIVEKDNRKWFDYIGIHMGKTEMTLYLPEKEYNNFDIETDTGDISIPDIFTFKNVKAETDTGDIELSSNVSGNLEITADTGDIIIKDIKPKAMSIETDTGKVKLLKGKSDSLNIETNTGDILIEDFVVKGKVNIKSNTGDVKLLKSDAGSFEIETNTGDVSGTLLSDKIFYTETDTGKINLPNEFSGGECRIKTDTGDISFKIDKIE